MPKNQEIIESIKTESQERGLDVPKTDGKNNEQLLDILKQVKAVPPVPPGNDGDGGEDDDTESTEAKPPFTIADGCALTTMKGILSEGDEVKTEYLSDGEDGLKRHIKSGIIVKN